MRPIFTVHAGEYLVGSKVEGLGYNVWLPAKDSGVDLLATDSKNRRVASLQVKFSKDFMPPGTSGSGLKALGWWSLGADKIRESKADLWVLALCSLEAQRRYYIVIPPRDLWRNLVRLHPGKKTIQTYFWVTESDTCWEARGLSKKDQKLVRIDEYSNCHREFSQYLDNWKPLKQLLG